MIRLCLLAGLVCLAMPNAMLANPVELAKSAQLELEQAGRSLQEARRANDRVSALTKTVRAYEAGLEALRSGLNQTQQREREIRTLFETKQEKLAQLLVVLQTMGRDPVPTILLHPSGPTNTTRAAMMVQDVAAQIETETEALKQQLSELTEISALHETASEALSIALSEAQTARSELTQAMADRVALPRSFNPDPVQMRNLVRSSETFGEFITQLTRINIDSIHAKEGFEQRKGQLASPTTGRVLHGFAEPNAAGTSRPGVILAAPREAIVITPTDATVRYAGALLDYGKTIILEPAPGYLMILAGLDTLDAEAGQVLSSGTPVGKMGGTVPDADGFLNTAANDGSGNPQETLYIELRNGDTALDPEVWFALQKE